MTEVVFSALTLPGGAAHGAARHVEVTMKLSRADAGRRFRVLAVPTGGAPIEIGVLSVIGPHCDHPQPTNPRQSGCWRHGRLA